MDFPAAVLGQGLLGLSGPISGPAVDVNFFLGFLDVPQGLNANAFFQAGKGYVHGALEVILLPLPAFPDVNQLGLATAKFIEDFLVVLVLVLEQQIIIYHFVTSVLRGYSFVSFFATVPLPQ